MLRRMLTSVFSTRLHIIDFVSGYVARIKDWWWTLVGRIVTLNRTERKC